jgi:hypothetical protein
VVKSSDHRSLPFSVDLTVEEYFPQALAKAAIAQAFDHFHVTVDGIFGEARSSIAPGAHRVVGGAGVSVAGHWGWLQRKRYRHRQHEQHRKQGHNHHNPEVMAAYRRVHLFPPGSLVA